MFEIGPSLKERRMTWLSKMRPESVMIRSGYHNVMTVYRPDSLDIEQSLQYVPRSAQQVLAVVTWSHHGLTQLDEDTFRTIAHKLFGDLERSIESNWEA